MSKFGYVDILAPLECEMCLGNVGNMQAFTKKVGGYNHCVKGQVANAPLLPVFLYGDGRYVQNV